jgi:uncharacterized protein YkwD
MNRPLVAVLSTRMMRSRCLPLTTPLALAAAACGALAPEQAARSTNGAPPSHVAVAPNGGANAASRPAPELDPAEERFAWKSSTFSPRPGGAFDPRDQTLLETCRAGDEALAAAASRIADRKTRSLSALDMSQVTFALRAEGSPYVWPRAWMLEGTNLDRADAELRMRRWLDSFGDGGERRCGVATLDSNGKQVIAAVAIDALADLSSMPTRVRAGQWLDVRARLLVPATDAKVVVLGPVGRPKTVLSSLQVDQVVARFSADRGGPWLVQVVASVRSGPRPVAEAVVHADVEPPSAFYASPAPGEHGAVAGDDAATAIARMVNAARASERLPSLQRDARLDALARTQAGAMRTARRVGHDVGLGDVKGRITASGLDVAAAGENVSHAANAQRAHRALWASPSHRGNLLHPRYNSLGVGTATDSDGSLWVCEVFADFR